MRLLDRYLFRELLAPLAYCVVGFLIFWVAFDLFSELDDLQQYKLHLWDYVQYYLVRTPEFLATALPIALLLALLYTITTHSRHNEISAIRAAGVSLWRLCLPYFGVGLAASIALFVLNEFCIPNSVETADAILHGRTTSSPEAVLKKYQVRNFSFSNERDGRTWQIGTYDQRTGEMTQPNVYWLLPDGSRRWFIAERGIRSNGVWTFFDVREFKDVKQTNSIMMRAPATNMLAMPEFTETPEEIKSEIEISGKIGLKMRKANIPIVDILDYLRLHPNPRRGDRAWLYTKLHGRLAAPWQCVVVVLIAIPFAAVSGRRNIFMGVASGILICFVYFILAQVGLTLASAGHLAPWLGAWIPNLFFGITGLWLTARSR